MDLEFILPVMYQQWMQRAVSALIVGLVSLALPAEAQESALLAAVQELTAAPAQAAKLRLRMEAALAEWDRQIQALEAAPSRDHLRLGLAYHRRGRFADAIRAFDAASAQDPRAPDPHLLRALALDATGRAGDASRAFVDAWTRDPDNAIAASLVLQRATLDIADRARAIAVLEQALQRVVAGRGRPDAAPFVTLSLIPDTVARTPLIGAGMMSGVYAHLAAGRLDEAVAALENASVPAASARPDGTEGSPLERGQAAEAEGRLADAAREYARAIDAAMAGRHALYVGLGRLAQVQGDTGAAIEAFTHAVRLSPNDVLLRRELAAAHIAAGRTDDAFAELVAALLIAPENADTLAAVGQLYLDTDRAAAAIPVLQRALAVRADRYATHYALATAFARSGQTAEAAREFDTFERLNKQALDARRRTVAGDGPK